jgi:hypothetical protein
MKSRLLFFTCLFSIPTILYGQPSKSKTLVVIDSVAFLDGSKEWNRLSKEEVSEYTIISNRDSLDRLGWKQLDTVTYVFTKEYRNRPDSIKKLPRVRQFVLKDGIGHWNGVPYTGRYIDYYVNGKIQSEGMMLNGQTHGEVILYYNNGSRRNLVSFKEGLRDGAWKQYYKNGEVMMENEFSFGRANGAAKVYFINGQVQQEIKPKKNTGYDTLLIYFSSGKIKNLRTGKSGHFYLDRKEENLKYYSNLFYHHLGTGNLKEANKQFYQIWQKDSEGLETHFMEGLLLAREFHFDDAITHFDKALEIEPFFRDALEQRILARIKRVLLASNRISFKDRTEVPLALKDFLILPEDEKEKVCRDLVLLDTLDTNLYYSSNTIPEAIWTHCQKKPQGLKIKL